jgi:hypothetical protein
MQGNGLKKYWVLFLLLTAGALLAVLATWGPVNRFVAVNPVAHDAPLKAGEVGTKGPYASPVWGGLTAPNSQSRGASNQATLLDDYYRPQNILQFIEKAKLQPEKGGVALAIKALGVCLSARQSWQPERMQDLVSEEQRKARSILQHRCESAIQFAQSFDDGLRLGAIDALKEQFGAKDPVIQARKKIYSSANDKSANLSEYAITIFELLGGALMHLQEFKLLGGDNIYFVGKPFGGVSADAFDTALAIYRVDRALKSGDGTIESAGLDALLICGVYGLCAGSAIDRAVSSLPSSSRMRKELLTLYPILKQALDASDIQAFRKP